jgi:ABC-type amino acid transport substrate-binding protein
MQFFRTGFLLLLILLQSCSSPVSKKAIRIGVDPNWYPIDFGSQQSYVNGYVEDLLIEMADYNGVGFVRIPANWDTLLDDLNHRKYDAIITSLPAYDYNQAKYDFSKNILDLGPVLIVPSGSQYSELEKIKGEAVGIITGDPAVLILQKYPDIIVRNFLSVPDLLNAVVSGQIEAALLNRIPAVNYINDLYSQKLKIVSPPMTNAGLHVITLKGKQEPFLHTFNKSVKHFYKKKKLEMLMKKWGLD